MRCLAVLAIVAIASLAVPACSHAPPIAEPAITCGTTLVTPENIKRIERDLGNLDGGGQADLLAWIIAEGPDLVACLIDWYVQNGKSNQKTAAGRFKTEHKAQLAPATSNLLKGGGADHLAARVGALPNEAPGAQAACQREPGADDPGVSLSFGCGHSQSPPGKGPGLVRGGGA